MSIHVERVIGQLKKLKILQQTLPIVRADLLDKVMVVVSVTVNANRSGLNKYKKGLGIHPIQMLSDKKGKENK